MKHEIKASWGYELAGGLMRDGSEVELWWKNGLFAFEIFLQYPEHFSLDNFERLADF